MSSMMTRKEAILMICTILLGILGECRSSDENFDCQKAQPCVNGGVCHHAYLPPRYICKCDGDWYGQDCEERLPSATKGCSMNFYSESDTIDYPSIPQPTVSGTPLMPNGTVDCYYLIRVPSALSITLHFLEFAGEGANDKLIVFPGTIADVTLPNFREFNGTSSIQPQTFDTNQLVLHWVTDSTSVHSRFSIRYRIEPDPCWLNPCWVYGGVCTTLPTDYLCSCPPGIVGTNCEIVVVNISQTTISVVGGNPITEGSAEHVLTFDLSFSPAAPTFRLTGSDLWSVTLFLVNNASDRVVTQNVQLSDQQSSVEWRPPGTSTIRTIRATVNLDDLPCTQSRNVCAMIGQGASPSKNFIIQGTPDASSLFGCTRVDCQGGSPSDDNVPVNNIDINLILIVALSVSSALLVIAIIYAVGLKIKLRKVRPRPDCPPRELDPIYSEVESAQQGVVSPLSTVLEGHEDCGFPSWASECEIPWEDLDIDNMLLDRGNFGQLCSGTVKIDGNESKCSIKKLRGQASTRERQHFMVQFGEMFSLGDHRNVISLLAACYHEGDLYVVFEFPSSGDLRSYLRRARSDAGLHEDTALSAQLLKFARDVARGMEHLVGSGVVHRNLAARSILLGEGPVVKVSNFGLCREEDKSAETSERHEPIRWLSIESLTDKVHTTKSDVWSFGIVLWEIVTLGGKPYPSTEIDSITTLLQTGTRMTRPSNCHEKIYDLMSQCWKENPNDRPHFRHLVSRLTEIANNINI